MKSCINIIAECLFGREWSFVKWRCVFSSYRIYRWLKKTERRVCVNFCFKKVKLSTETCNLLKTAFGDKCLSRLNISMWLINLKMTMNQSMIKESGKTPTSISNQNLLKTAFGDKCLSRLNISMWLINLKMTMNQSMIKQVW